MKTPVFAHRSGFTLVELLVVIAIIAILAASGFVAGNVAMQKARKAGTLAICTEIEMGVNNFFTEYGTLPTDAAADEEIETKDADGVTFLEIMMAREDEGGTVLNTKGIRFIEPKEGKANKGGVIYAASGNAIQGLYDSWGGPYHVMLDADYDEQLVVQPKGAAASKTLNGRRVAVWSDGADGVEAGASGKAIDDVTTW